MEWKWSVFQSLTGLEVYEILRLRQEVFVVEQKCFYQDCDSLDTSATHLMGRIDGNLVAYLRVIPAGHKFTELSLGRVLTAAHLRGTGAGQQLMVEGLRRIELGFGKVPIRIAAQAHLKKFYENFSFQPQGEIFLEDGIPHLYMVRA